MKLLKALISLNQRSFYIKKNLSKTQKVRKLSAIKLFTNKIVNAGYCSKVDFINTTLKHFASNTLVQGQLKSNEKNICLKYF